MVLNFWWVYYKIRFYGKLLSCCIGILCKYFLYFFFIIKVGYDRVRICFYRVEG